MKRLLCLVLLIATPAIAQWNRDGQSVADENWRKSDGKFGVMLMLVDDAEKLFADWKKPETPHIKMVSTAKVGKPIFAVVFVAGCAEISGTCNSEVNFVVLRPDGSEYGVERNSALWKHAAPPGRNIQLSEANLGIRIEPQDVPGTYEVHAKARDLNANVTIDVSQTFVVEK